MLNTEKPHIGIFGKCNVGKSSFINSLSGQAVAIVSDIPGTTTDPVKKSIELGVLGPVILIDTGGIEDRSPLGVKRLEATYKTIAEIDLAIVLISDNHLSTDELDLIQRLKSWDLPYFIIHHQSDRVALNSDFKSKLITDFNVPILEYSSLKEPHADRIISVMKTLIPEQQGKEKSLLGDLVSYGDLIVLVTPIDIEAPKGRLILPQVQTIRNALDHECLVMVVKERELDLVFSKLKLSPKLVVTDSQAFLKVQAIVPAHIPLTSFSILQARLNNEFNTMVAGTFAIEKLRSQDRVLVLESCAHHVGGEDIGRVKIPRWLELYKGCQLQFECVSGLDHIQAPITDYALVIQCGGCMLSPRQLHNRLRPFIANHIPITNYGMVIAYSLGIFERALAPFGILDKKDDLYL